MLEELELASGCELTGVRGVGKITSSASTISEPKTAAMSASDGPSCVAFFCLFDAFGAPLHVCELCPSLPHFLHQIGLYFLLTLKRSCISSSPFFLCFLGLPGGLFMIGGWHGL